MTIFKKMLVGILLVVLICCLLGGSVFAFDPPKLYNQATLFNTEMADLTGDGQKEHICLYAKTYPYYYLVIYNKKSINIFPSKTEEFIISSMKLPVHEVLTINNKPRLFLLTEGNNGEFVSTAKVVEFAYSLKKNKLYPYKKFFVSSRPEEMYINLRTSGKVFLSIEKHYNSLCEAETKIHELINLAKKGEDKQIDNLVTWQGEYTSEEFKTDFRIGLRETKPPLPLFFLNINSGDVSTSISCHEGDSEICFFVDYKGSKIYVENHR